MELYLVNSWIRIFSSVFFFRVGPTAVLEAAHLLLMAASCEAQNTLDNQTGFLTCQNELHDRGITDAHCQWLARLLRTRRIVLIPTANPWGYYHDIRTEYDVDVNRDFAFDAEDATTCMRTIAARAINEIVREHTFQSGIVFHAGFEMIGYEWGANAYNGWRSPDDTSQSQIAEAHSRYGGGWDTSPPYVYGTMDQVIYTVHGSLEDWGYASSWDTDVVTQCAPTTYGGYAAEKTVYPPYTNRMFSMLVETSMDKTPTSDFGTSLDVLNPESSGNGHVPRNVRLSLLMIDLVEPYVWFTNDNDSSSDRMNTMVPFPESSGSSCRDNVMMQVEQETTMFEVSWEVGGAFQVDSTELWYAKWDNLPDTVMDCRTQPTIANVQQYMQAGFLTGPLGGTGRFSTTGSTVFAGTISLSNFTHGDIIVILASARVDSSWSNSASPLRPQVSPQTHIANVRTNPEYFYETETNVVRGRLDWFSQPLTVKVVSSSVSTNAPTVSLSIPSSSSSRVPLSSPTDADDTTTLTPTTQQRIETPTSASNHTGGSLTILLFGLLLTYLV
jgi:hypothetical protein